MRTSDHDGATKLDSEQSRLSAKGCALRAVLALSSVLVVLVIAEIALGLFPAFGPRSGTLVPPADPHWLTPRTLIGGPHYSGRLVGADFETTYELNSIGFRERELNFSDFGGEATHSLYR